MEVIGDPGARAICHDKDCIQLDESEIEALSKLRQSAAWGYLLRKVRPKLIPKEQEILDRWRDLGIDLAGVCAASHDPG